MGCITGGGKTEAKGGKEEKIEKKEKECQIEIGNKPETKTTPQKKEKTKDNKQEPTYVPKL